MKALLQSNEFHVWAHIVVAVAAGIVAVGGAMGITPTTHDQNTIAQVVAIVAALGAQFHIFESK